ncbi:MAG: N-acetylmuramoyl-L-alanine amidase [Patescibacteria group bacterium]
MKNKSIMEAFSEEYSSGKGWAAEQEKKSWFFVWSARMASLLMVLLILFLGIFAFGYADNIGQVKVDRLQDTDFVLKEANVLSTDWSGDAGEQTSTLTIPTGQNIFSYVSDAREAKRSFWMIAAKLSAKIPAGTKVVGKVRVSNDSSTWSEWYDLDLEKLSNEQNKDVTEVPILLEKKSKYAQYSLVLSSDDVNLTPEIYDVDLVLIDPDDKLALVKKGWSSLMARVSGSTGVDVISRSEWGADESIMTWDDKEYAPVEQIVVHHTAGSNNSPLDPAAVVRGIYYFHAVEKDWGDIGYNYIIDQDGNIYEGREGGFGVVAAHSSGNNYGSVGIAIIGNYSEDAPASQSMDGLINLVEYIGYQGDLDLTTKHNFEGNNVPVVAGHRDVNPTECPGDVLYAMLPDVAIAASQGENTLPAKTYQAQLVHQSQKSLDLKSGQIQKVVVTYKNSGSAVWLKQRGEVELVPVDPYPRSSGFATPDWDSVEVVGTMNQVTVMSGNEATFDLPLFGIDQAGQYGEKFALLGPDGLISGTEFSVNIDNQKSSVDSGEDSNIDNQNDQIIDDDNDSDNNTNDINDSDTSVVEADWYHSAWVAQTDHLTLYPGEEKSVWIDFKNTGKTPWYKDSDYPVRLGTANPQDRNSALAVVDSGWLSANRIEMSQWSVEPGEVARFRFTLKAGNNSSGVYQEYFRPVVENVTWMEDQGVYIQIEVVESQYMALFVEQSENPITLSSGRKARLWVELKNTGNVVWTKDSDTPVRLATDRDPDRASIFYSPGYWISDNRAASMKKNAVSPGDSVRFEVVVTAPDEPGSYREYFRPVADNMQWMDDLGIYWDINVE